MATVTTTLTPTIDVFSLSGFREPAAEHSHFARGLVTAVVQDAAVAATGAGDNQFVQANVALPQNFAYSLVNFNMAILNGAAGTNNWGNNLGLTMFDDIAGGARTKDIHLGGFSNGACVIGSTAREQKIYKTWNPVGIVVKPNGNGAAVSLNLQIFNETANDQAATLDLYMEFLQFDINQVHNVGVNSPMPVRNC